MPSGPSTEHLESRLGAAFHLPHWAMQANAVHLAAELPVLEGGGMQVLYPASVKAGTDLQVRAARLHLHNEALIGESVVQPIPHCTRLRMLPPHSRRAQGTGRVPLLYNLRV